jgi:hypothetical protein
MQPRKGRLPDLHRIERLAGAAFVATSDLWGRDLDLREVASFGNWLDRAADATAQGVALPSVEEQAPATAPGRTVAQVALSKLGIEIEHVAASAQ